jgi:hypothetical protein
MKQVAPPPIPPGGALHLVVELHFDGVTEARQGPVDHRNARASAMTMALFNSLRRHHLCTEQGASNSSIY